MTTAVELKIVRPLRLWVVRISDSTPGWGLSHTAFLLSTRKPRRADVLEEFDWCDLLRVSPGFEDLERYERENISVSVDPASAEEAELATRGDRQIHVLRIPAALAA